MRPRFDEAPEVAGTRGCHPSAGSLDAVRAETGGERGFFVTEDMRAVEELVRRPEHLARMHRCPASCTGR